MTTGVAIIGCGLIGGRRAVALESRKLPVLAVYDVDVAAADRLATSLDHDVLVARSVDEVLSTPGVGLVVVATVHAALVPIALQAVAAGHAVLVEKPGAATLTAIEELATLVHTGGVVVRVGFNHRFHPSIVRAKELVTEGGYGRLLHVRGRYGHGGRLGYEAEWRADRAVSGGGELLDQGVHLIDLTRHLAGDVDLAFAELRTDFWDMDVEDNAFLALRCRAGGFAWLHASWTEWKNLFSLEIAMERAKIEINGLGGSYGTERLALYEMRPELGPPDTTAWEWPRGDDSWSAEIDDLIAALSGQSSAGATVDDAVAALRVIDEAYRS